MERVIRVRPLRDARDPKDAEKYEKALIEAQARCPALPKVTRPAKLKAVRS